MFERIESGNDDLDIGELIRRLEARDESDQPTRSEHPLFAQLGELDRDFTNWYYETDLRPRDPGFKERSRQVVTSYIGYIREYRSEITPDMLLAGENRFSGRVDPVFAFLVKAMCGSRVMNEEVYQKVRKAWCGSDIPYELGDLLLLSDDDFLAQFKEAELDPSGQIKLTALSEMGVMESLMQERHQLSGR